MEEIPTVAELLITTMRVRPPTNPNSTLRVLIRRPNMTFGGFTIMLVPRELSGGQLEPAGKLVWSYTGPVILDV